MSKAFSSYLTTSMPLLEELIAKLTKKFPYCSILGCDSKGKNYRVSSKTTNITDNDIMERGFVVRVHNGTNYAEYSFNEISKQSLPIIIERIEKELLLSDKLKSSKFLSLKAYKVFEEEEMTKDFARVYPSKELNSQEIVSKLVDLRKIMEAKPNVVNAITVYQQLDISKVFISTKKKLTQFYTWCGVNLVCITSKDDDTRSSYEGISGVDPKNVFDRAESLIDQVCTDANDMIGTGQIEPGVYDVIADPGIAGLIAHEAFGHGVEMDMFVKGRAKAVEYVNKPVASTIVTMHEGALNTEEVSSYFFDDEGTLAHDTVEIKNGVLKTGVCDAISAMILGIEPTGNGKRESFERKAYTRMTSTYFEPGTSTPEEMIASVKHGYLISGMYSGMEDPKNWGIQCAAMMGREIKDGKFTGKVVSPVLLTGYVPDLLGSISMASNKGELFGSGFCGKGYKEWVKTADGGPYLKVKVNVG